MKMAPTDPTSQSACHPPTSRRPPSSVSTGRAGPRATICVGGPFESEAWSMCFGTQCGDQFGQASLLHLYGCCVSLFQVVSVRTLVLISLPPNSTGASLKSFKINCSRRSISAFSRRKGSSDLLDPWSMLESARASDELVYQWSYEPSYYEPSDILLELIDQMSP